MKMNFLIRGFVPNAWTNVWTKKKRPPRASSAESGEGGREVGREGERSGIDIFCSLAAIARICTGRRDLCRAIMAIP